MQTVAGLLTSCVDFAHIVHVLLATVLGQLGLCRLGPVQ